MSDADGGNASDDKARAGSRAFWTTLPGILTGLAALLTAIGGLIVVLNGMGDDGGRAGARGETSTILRDGTPTSGPPFSLVTPSDTDALLQGTLSMKSPDDANLDRGVVGSVSPSDLYLYCAGLSCHLTPVGSGLMTVAGRAGTKAECVAALNARNDGTLDLSKLATGSTLCTQTGQGHVARLQVTALPGLGSSNFTFAYYVWR